LIERGSHPASFDSPWSKTLGSLRTNLLRLDSQVGAVVKAAKQVVDPVVVFDEVPGQLERIARQMGLVAADGTVDQSDSVPRIEPAKPGFTRESGSFRRQVSPYGAQDPGE
jgi:hypothetical protein